MAADYEISAGNTFVLRGNVAVIPCSVPSYSASLLHITWLRETLSEPRTTGKLLMACYRVDKLLIFSCR